MVDQSQDFAVELARRLVSEEGRSLLQTWKENGTVSSAAVRGRDPLVSAATGLLELRHRAIGKLDTPDRWWLTDRGLQQASSSRIASYKATRLRQADGAIEPRWCDLCSGVGGDLIALAAHAPVVSVDRDPVLRLYQRATLEDHGLAERVQPKDITLGDEAWSMEGFTAWHLDPDRRSETGRATRVDGFSPSTDWIERQISNASVGCLKLAPATVVSPEWCRGREREWIGDAGECKQQLLWSGTPFSESLGRRVTLLDGPWGVRSWEFDPHAVRAARMPVTLTPGAWVWEPHAACFAADAVSSLSEHLSISPISADGGYGVLACDEQDNPGQLEAQRWGAVFQIERVESLDRRKLTRVLKEMNAGIVEWKKRGIPADWLAKVIDLRGDGERLISALVYRGAKRVEVALGTRVAMAQ